MGTQSATATVLNGLPGVRAWQEPLYKHIHEHPELSHQEVETAKTVAQHLRDAGFTVTEKVGGTGVVGVLRNGDGGSVLLRSELDALPVKEDTGLPYASTAVATDPQGKTVPVAHACGHDIHITCLLGASRLMSDHTEAWSGTLIALFQPAEEVGNGASGMVEDHLADIVGHVDVALAQHVLPLAAGTVGTRSGAVLSAGDTLRVTLHGRGGHGASPQATVDPIVMAAMAVVRLQSIVSREIAPTETAVVTVGSFHAGDKGNVIPDDAVLEINARSYNPQTRQTVLDSIHEIINNEAASSNAPQPPDFVALDEFPPTINDAATTATVRTAFDAYFGNGSTELALQTASEDFSDIPNALGAPYTYWGLGGIDPEQFAAAAKAGTIEKDIPYNHSPKFAPVIQPTLDVGTSALVVASLAWLAGPNAQE